MHIDLNCDLGESFGRYTLGLDNQVIPLVSSCNIACGMHAGDPLVMDRTVALAAENGCAVGAHPGYPDLQGFGRRNMDLSPEEVRAFVLYQIGALDAFCHAHGTKVTHVKPHGQMYNRAAIDEGFAACIAKAVHDFDPELVLVGLAGSKLVEAGKDADLRTAGEFFVDRAYNDDGTLVSRSHAGAVISDEGEAIDRLVRAIKTGTITSITGKTRFIVAQTICVHGDNAHALAFVQRCRGALATAGIDIKPTSVRPA